MQVGFEFGEARAALLFAQTPLVGIELLGRDAFGNLAADLPRMFEQFGPLMTRMSFSFLIQSAIYMGTCRRA